MRKDYLFQFLFNEYQNYIWEKFQSRIIPHEHLKQSVYELSQRNNISVKELGKSLNSKEIYLIEIGTGTTSIALWSQMHGDEPTATKAIFDVLNFLTADDEYNEFRKFVLNKLKLYFIPMVNPDGAENFQRENAFQIDINRDYQSTQTIESSILKNTVEKIKPEFAFNLHDQNNYYSAGNTNKASAVSFLAPPEDYENSISDVRKKAMQVIAKLHETLAKHIPGHIARYKDEFEPRSFGDNFTRSGFSTILIESGSWQNDRNKSFVRKLNFISLLRSFEIIADEEYSTVDHQLYFSIPENKETFFDLVLRKLDLLYKGKKYTVDIAVNRDESYDAGKNFFYYNGIIKDIGDLSVYSGHEEYDLKDHLVMPAKIYPTTIDDEKNLTSEFLGNLIFEGFGYVKTKNFFPDVDYVALPVNIITKKNFQPEIKREKPANLIISQKNKIKYAVINGFFCDSIRGQTPVVNGIII